MNGYIVIVGILFLVAGCVESEGAQQETGSDLNASPPPEAAPAEFSEDTGGIEGTVTDAELQTIGGALISIDGLDVTTESAQDGRFTFSRLTPGEYTLFAAALGYESVGKRVTVAAGAATPVALTLAPIPITEPYYEIQQAMGMLACAVDIQPVVGVAACGAPVINTTLSDRFLIVWQLGYPTEDWDGLVVETHWTSNQILSQGLSPIWEITGCPNDNDVTFDEGGGRSPVIFYVNEENITEVIDNAAEGKGCASSDENCNADDCLVVSRMFSEAETTQQAADVGLTWQQTYENFFTSFFHSSYPEGFTAKQDA